MNISIRIGSPGNNGPVSQTNISIGIGSSSSPPSTQGEAPGTPGTPSDTVVEVQIEVETLFATGPAEATQSAETSLSEAEAWLASTRTSSSTVRAF